MPRLLEGTHQPAPLKHPCRLKYYGQSLRGLPFLREARRVLKPGGVAAMTVRAPEALKEALAQTGVYTLYTDQEIVRLFHEAGLSAVRVERAQFELGAALCILGSR